MRILFLSLPLFLLVGQVFGQKLTIAVAANAQYVMEALRDEFTKETNIDLQLIVGSSGKLTAQIQQGAPFDVFMSADMKYPAALYKENLTVEAPKVYALGTLVLWSMQAINLSKGVSVVLQNDVKKIAIANPKLAPYGEAAVAVLKAYQVYAGCEPKLVFGESIAQVNQYILSQAVQAGFTAKSVVMEPAMKGKGKWIELDRTKYTPIEQGVVLLKNAKGQNLLAARKFVDFLFSNQAKAIFKQYGYLVK